MGGGIAIPKLPVVRIINPIDGDNRAHIQSAIDEVSALPLSADGFRGALLLKAGEYPISDLLYIRASGVVIRGEGTGLDKTVIIGTNNNRKFETDWTKGLITIEPISYSITWIGTPQTIVGTLVPTGTKKSKLHRAQIFPGAIK